MSILCFTELRKLLVSTKQLIGEITDDPYQDRLSVDDGSCKNYTSTSEYFADNGNNSEVESMPRCPNSNTSAKVLLFVYMFVGNVILLNMLIAMMSNTFNKVTSDDSAHRNKWFLWKYRIVDEYVRKPVWVPPFTLRKFVSGRSYGPKWNYFTVN